MVQHVDVFHHTLISHLISPRPHHHAATSGDAQQPSRRSWEKAKKHQASHTIIRCCQSFLGIDIDVNLNLTASSAAFYPCGPRDGGVSNVLFVNKHLSSMPL